ncbi:MAG: NHLP leader peptide family RiPP precursor [Candidatus Nanopelagicales bacterium]
MTKDKLDELVNQTAVDLELRDRLLADPRGTLAEHGIDVPEDVEIQVVEGSRKVVHLPLFPYVGDQLSPEQLEEVAGGANRKMLENLVRTNFLGRQDSPGDEEFRKIQVQNT